eukprot:GSMAST32.ASY1.ANO1.41.1 assembled CDS
MMDRMFHKDKDKSHFFVIGSSLGAALGFIAARWYYKPHHRRDHAAASGVWNHPDSFKESSNENGFCVRNVGDGDIDVMMEKWDKGSTENPHSHPGDDMTVIVEGQMSIQSYVKDGDELKKKGPVQSYRAGDILYCKANTIHDAKYTEDCKLVYIHNQRFGKNEH